MSWFSRKNEPKPQDSFPASTIDSNIDESLKTIKNSDPHGLEFGDIADANAKPSRIFSDDDTLLFAHTLQAAGTSIPLERLVGLIMEVFQYLKWPKVVDLGPETHVKIKNKLRWINSAMTKDQLRGKAFTDGWYQGAEHEIMRKIEEYQKHAPPEPAAQGSSLTGSSRRLRYTEAEETMFRHWMIQGKRRNYIFSAYNGTRSKESIIHKMKSVRKHFSRPNPIEGKEHIKLYTEKENFHFDETNLDGFCAPGPIPPADYAAFKERINELLKTRSIMGTGGSGSVTLDDEDDAPYTLHDKQPAAAAAVLGHHSSGSTSINLNLLRNYVVMSTQVQNEFAKVERHVVTADSSWVDAGNTVRRARALVENALNLTKNRASHELDDEISAEELTELLGRGQLGQGLHHAVASSLKDDFLVSDMQPTVSDPLQNNRNPKRFKAD